jgi:hypothetical protein
VLNQVHAHPADVTEAEEEPASGLKPGEFREQSLRALLAENVEPGPVRPAQRTDGNPRDIADRHETVEHRRIMPQGFDPLRRSIASIAPQVQEADSLRMRTSPSCPRHGKGSACRLRIVGSESIDGNPIRLPNL